MKTRHFLVLFFVIALAVTCGNLLSNYITARFVVYGAQQADNAVAFERQKMTQQTQAGLEEISDAAKKQRARSKKAKIMWRSCVDWTAMHQQKQTYTTEKESKKQCAIYHRYVDTGL